MKWLNIVIAILTLYVVPGSVQAQALRSGDTAPPFELPGSDENTHRLADYEGTTVVLAWFPKAFTGG